MTEEEKNEQEEVEQENNESSPSTEDVKTESGESKTTDTVPYARFKEVIEEKNEWKQKAQDFKEQLENIDDPEELKEEYEGQINELESKFETRHKEYALKEKALAEGVNKKALDDFVAVADLDKLDIDDEGSVSNVDELIKTMKEEKEYFFETEGGVDRAGEEFKGSGESDSISSLRKAMKLD